jgi:hypothetical protein
MAADAFVKREAPEFLRERSTLSAGFLSVQRCEITRVQSAKRFSAP